MRGVRGEGRGERREGRGKRGEGRGERGGDERCKREGGEGRG
jgi:hypothetical protein